MAPRGGMLRLELTYLHLANGDGCFRWRDEDRTYLRSEHDSRPEVGSDPSGPLDGHRCRSGNVGFRMSPTTCCGLSACDAFASSKFRRRMWSESMGQMPSVKMLGNDCSTRPASIVLVV